jgi:hypothetical protein
MRVELIFRRYDRSIIIGQKKRVLAYAGRKKDGQDIIKGPNERASLEPHPTMKAALMSLMMASATATPFPEGRFFGVSDFQICGGGGEDEGEGCVQNEGGLYRMRRGLYRIMGTGWGYKLWKRYAGMIERERLRARERGMGG